MEKSLANSLDSVKNKIYSESLKDLENKFIFDGRTKEIIKSLMKFVDSGQIDKAKDILKKHIQLGENDEKTQRSVDESQIDPIIDEMVFAIGFYKEAEMEDDTINIKPEEANQITDELNNNVDHGTAPGIDRVLELEEIINSKNESLSDPEKSPDTLEDDFIAYAKATYELDNPEDNNYVDDLIDAYYEILTEYKGPDTLPALVKLLPKVKVGIVDKIKKFKKEKESLKKGKNVSNSIEQIDMYIEYYESAKEEIDFFEQSLQNNDEESDKDIVDANFMGPDIQSQDFEIPQDTTEEAKDEEIDKNNLNSNGVAEEDKKNEDEEVVTPKVEKKELTPHEKFEDYLFKKGIKQIIVHGQDYQDKNGNTKLVSKMDFDIDSALQVLDEVGVQFTTDAKCTWVHPQSRMEREKNGRAYFMIDGEKMYLPKGTMIIDVGGTNGFNIEDGDIFTLDHHSDSSDNETSSTKILVENLKELPRYINGDSTFPEFLDNYTELVTKIDNLSMDTNMEFEDFKKNYANTMYALEPFVYYKNKRMLMDIFRKYPNINLNGFTEEEKKYVVGVKEFTKQEDKGFTSKKVNLYSEIPKIKKTPEDPNEEFKYEEFTIGDLVENQQNAVENSIKDINYHTQKMFRDGLTVDSKIMGRTIFVDVENWEYVDKRTGKIKEFKDYTNNFGAVTAYNMYYDTMIILNRKEGNRIFISSKNKEGLQQFSENLSLYYDNGIIVRDSMYILRDPKMKNEDVNNVREAIIDSAGLNGFKEDELSKEIQELLVKARSIK